MTEARRLLTKVEAARLKYIRALAEVRAGRMAMHVRVHAELRERLCKLGKAIGLSPERVAADIEQAWNTGFDRLWQVYGHSPNSHGWAGVVSARRMSLRTARRIQRAWLKRRAKGGYPVEHIDRISMFPLSGLPQDGRAFRV